MVKKIKKFVQERYKFDRDDLNLHILYKKFNTIIDHLKIDRNKEKFNKIIKSYIDNDNWYYIMSFVCLVAANKQILNQDEEIIYDIVTAVFETNLSITKYRFFSNILLSNIINDWLREMHQSDVSKVSPEFALEEIIENYNMTKSIGRNLDDIAKYLEEFKNSKDKETSHLLFNGINSFDEMYAILENKMEEFNEFTMTYGSVQAFSDSTMNDCKYIKKLKYMSLENQEKALEILHKLDEDDEDIPIIEKYNSIINAARILFNIYGQNKVISIDFSKKL